MLVALFPPLTSQHTHPIPLMLNVHQVKLNRQLPGLMEFGLKKPASFLHLILAFIANYIITLIKLYA